MGINVERNFGVLQKAVLIMLVVAALVWCICFVFFPRSGQEALFWGFAEQNFFYDFYTNRAVAEMQHPYVEETYCDMVELSNVLRRDQCYPALANLWVGMFPNNLTGVLACTSIGVVVFVWGLIAFFRRTIPEKVTVATALVCCSAPFLIAIGVANLILYAVGFSLVFLAWYDSTSRKRRWIAALALALAVVLKITPVLLGLIYLDREWRKRLKYVIISALIALAAFVVPFMFCGGLDAMQAWFENASMNSAEYAMFNRFGLIGFVTELKWAFTMSDLDWWARCALRVMTSCLGMTVIVLGVLFGDDLWNKGCAFVIGMLFIPPTMMSYTALYIIPFAISGMCHDNDRIRKISSVYCLSLCMTLRIPLYLGMMGSLNTCFAAAASVDLAIALSVYLWRKRAHGNGTVLAA